MKKTIIGLALALGLSVGAYAASVELVHDPVLAAAAGQDIEVRTVLTGGTPNTRVRLFYRTKGKELYRSIEMGGSPSALTAMIPGKGVEAVGMEYYIEAAEFTGGTKVVVGTSPSNNPALTPHQIAVRQDQAGPELQVLSPMDGETLDQGRPVITVSWSDEDSGVDPKSAIIKIDDVEINDPRNIDAFDSLLSYVPGKQLADGEHQITVVVRDKSGNAGAVKWKVTIKAGADSKAVDKSKKVVWSGNASYETYYGATLTAPKKSNLPYRPYGTNRGRLDVAGRGQENVFRARIVKTDEERSDQQPVDRYLASIKNDQGVIQAGDLSFGETPNFSELSLYNPSYLRGVSMDLRSGKLNEGHTRLMGVWGQTQRPIESGVSAFSGSGGQATFGQYLYGARWEFGHPYFQMGLNHVTVNDQPGSLANPGSVKPKFNNVSTSDLSISTPYLSLHGETGVSFLAADPTLFSLSVGSGYRAGANIDIRQWSTHASFDWKDLGGGFGFLPGGYSTMGNPGLQIDYRGFETELTQGLFEDQFNLSLGYNAWRDNLQGIKPAITTNDFLSVGVNIAPQRMPYLNVGMTQAGMNNDATGNTSAGSLKINNLTRSLSVGLGYTRALEARRTISGNVNWVGTTFSDLAPLRLSQDLSANTFGVSSFVNWERDTYSANISMGTQDQGAFERTDPNNLPITLAARATRSSSYGLRWGHQWLERIFDTNLSYDMSLYDSSSKILGLISATSSTSTRNTITVGGNYVPRENHRINASFSFVSVTSDASAGGVSAGSDSLSQLVSNLSYQLTF